MRLSDLRIASALFFTAASLALAAQDAGGSSVLESLNTSEPVSFSGTLTATAGGAAGWPLNPIRTGFADTGSVVGISFENLLRFDARPDPSFRVHGTLDTTYAGNYSFSLTELFLDYSISDAVFIRAGEQSIGWGSGRVFAVGDLMSYPVGTVSSHKSAAATIKTYVPFGSNGITAVALAPAYSATLSASDLSYAAKLDLVLGTIELSEEALRRGDGSVDYSSSAKTSLFDIDIYAQTFGTWTSNDGFSFSTLENVYWESSSPRVKLYAEHWYSGASSYTIVDDAKTYVEGNYLAAGVGWTPDESIGIKLGLLWVGALDDRSGIVMPIATYQPWSFITLSCGAIARYGESTSTYGSFSALPPGHTLPFSWKEKYSIILMASVALDY
jgi:hypothetical protein